MARDNSHDNCYLIKIMEFTHHFCNMFSKEHSYKRKKNHPVL